MKQREFILKFSYPLDYDGLSDEVVMWAYARYQERIQQYEALPWWRRIFRKNPSFVLKRTYDDLFGPPAWSMKLKTIDGTFRVEGRLVRRCIHVEYMRPEDRFDQVLLSKK